MELTTAAPANVARTYLEATPLRLFGTYLICGAPRYDERGYFMRVSDEEVFHRHGLQTHWVQENQAYSRRKGVIRGLHFQKPPYTETKLVRSVVGRILDVFVDLRRDSETYSHWDSVILSADEHNMVYIPKGFAHGYCTLTEESVVLYKVDAPYTPVAEGGIRWSDDTLNIPWPAHELVVSPKDRLLSLLSDFDSPFGSAFTRELSRQKPR